LVRVLGSITIVNVSNLVEGWVSVWMSVSASLGDVEGPRRTRFPGARLKYSRVERFVKLAAFAKAFRRKQ
jgi:hypothetical protein